LDVRLVENPPTPDAESFKAIFPGVLTQPSQSGTRAKIKGSARTVIGAAGAASGKVASTRRITAGINALL
jgi:hypothetical protein